MKFWSSRLTLPVDDPFWDHHHPGERWGCKCTCEQTDEPVNDLGVHDDIPDTASKGLHGNPHSTALQGTSAWKMNCSGRETCHDDLVKADIYRVGELPMHCSRNIRPPAATATVAGSCV